MITYRPVLHLFACAILFTSASCNRKSDAKVHVPDQQAMSTAEFIKQNIRFALSTDDGLKTVVDSNQTIRMIKALHYYYHANQYQPVWVDTGRWTKQATVMMQYLDTASYDGLYRNDYHFQELSHLQSYLEKDSVSMLDGRKWTQAEILLTDAFMHVIMDLKQGRLQDDSLSWKHDTILHRTFFAKHLHDFKDAPDMNALSVSFRPPWPGFDSLRNAVATFVNKIDSNKYTYLEFPFKRGDAADSVSFYKKLRLRLSESNLVMPQQTGDPDSVQLSGLIKQYQKKHNLVTDGKAGPALIRSLNLTDSMKFKLLAVTFDKYKKLSAILPEKYVWVNIPAFHLHVWDTDSVAFESKIICGKVITPTPLLQSAITDMVIYPTWTVPESIIKKELLPGLKKNPGYLARKGLNLYNAKGDMVDPVSVNWSKYVKGIPYIVRQGSGDNNALGVIKFNFDNPYQVYLHDTNQRGLFRNSFRALSHGCVRVQEWEKLAQFLLQQDSLKTKPTDTLRYTFDSVKTWIAEKQKHRVYIKNRLSLFIRYMTCEGRNGEVVFYDDIYNEDKKLTDTYFAGK